MPHTRSVILLADDDEMLRTMLANYLTASGYDVLTAADGREALAMLEGNAGAIRLVVSDYDMAHINGNDVAAAAKRLGIPTILISGSLPPLDAVQGFWEYIAKPFHPETLRQAIATKLGQEPERDRELPKVILAEDDATARERLCGLLSSEYDVQAFEEGASVIEKAGEIRPEAVVLDIVMPGLNGIAVARTLRQSMPEVPVLFVTQHSETPYNEEAFASGAAGYVLKGRAAAELIPALRRVRAGGRYISPGLRPHVA
ncbi:MAG TPA: response regulator [Bryobacteraceae bacterium]|nr:response regulator [Bryobacteraceae bacterium]